MAKDNPLKFIVCFTQSKGGLRIDRKQHYYPTRRHCILLDYK